MSYRRPPEDPPRVLHAPPVAEPVAEAPADVEQRVAITLSVADGFKFGCGLILAGVAFYFALIMVVAVALLFAMLLNLPLPFGL
jgi:hypothetical protein